MDVPCGLLTIRICVPSVTRVSRDYGAVPDASCLSQYVGEDLIPLFLSFKYAAFHAFSMTPRPGNELTLLSCPDESMFNSGVYVGIEVEDAEGIKGGDVAHVILDNYWYYHAELRIHFVVKAWNAEMERLQAQDLPDTYGQSVAICITGMARTITKVYESIKVNVSDALGPGVVTKYFHL